MTDEPKKSILFVIKDNLSAVVAVIAAISAFGITISAPWPSRAEMMSLVEQVKEVKRIEDERHKETEAQIKSLLKDQTEIGRTTLRIQKIFIKLELEEAEKELLSSPNSRAAKLRVEELKETIRTIDSQLFGGAHP